MGLSEGTSVCHKNVSSSLPYFANRVANRVASACPHGSLPSFASRSSSFATAMSYSCSANCARLGCCFFASRYTPTKRRENDFHSGSSECFSLTAAASRSRCGQQDVFGDDGLEVFRNVFAAAGSLIAGSLECPVTIRAAWKDLFSRAIRFGQRLSRASGVTGLSASFLLAFPILRLDRRFREGRNCSGRCVGADGSRTPKW